MTIATKRVWLYASVAAACIVIWLIYISTTTADHTRGARAVPSLQLVVVVSRHGNRPPLAVYPSYQYPSSDASVWPFGKEQITERGRMQLYKLGRKIRSLYSGFLDKHYYENDFKASSTLKDRTMSSAQGFLAGLFPPKDFQVWNDQLEWQPVPVYPNYLDHTEIVQSDENTCPRVQQEIQKYVAQFEKDYKSNLTSYLDYFPGQNISLVKALYTMWESLASADDEGLPDPGAWTKDIYPQPSSSLMSKAIAAYSTASDTMLRLVQGPMFGEIADHMQAKAAGSLTPDRRMFYYSGHDFTLGVLHGILGVREVAVIKTGSALIFELHRDPRTGVNYVQVLYINRCSPDLEPTNVNMPDCADPCRLRVLLDLTEKFRNITDWNSECQLVNSNSTDN